MAGKTEAKCAQGVKNAYDAIEQAISAAIAAGDERIPIRPPFEGRYVHRPVRPERGGREEAPYWLRRRSDSRYVDIRGDQINIPHELFNRDDAQESMEDAQAVMDRVERILAESESSLSPTGRPISPIPLSTGTHPVESGRAAGAQ